MGDRDIFILQSPYLRPTYPNCLSFLRLKVLHISVPLKIEHFKYSHNYVQPTSLKSRTLYVKLFLRNEKIISWKYYWLSSYVTSCRSSTLPSRRTTRERDEARRETKVPLTWEAIRML